MQPCYNHLLVPRIFWLIFSGFLRRWLCHLWTVLCLPCQYLYFLTNTFFSLPYCISKISSTELKRSGGRRHLCLVHGLSGGFPSGSSGKESACNASNTADPGSIPESGRYPGGGNGNPLQLSCMENPTDRGAWWATVHGVAKSRTQLGTRSLSLSLALVKMLQVSGH